VNVTAPAAEPAAPPPDEETYTLSPAMRALTDWYIRKSAARGAVVQTAEAVGVAAGILSALHEAGLKAVPKSEPAP
jgi:hypothetical protein